MNTFDMLVQLVAAWQEGGRRLRLAIGAAAAIITLGSLIALLSQVLVGDDYIGVMGRNVGVAIAILGIVLAMSIVALQTSKQHVRREERIEAVERRVQENPRETQAAWELARVKLESYLDRNLSQVRSIFWLTLLVMSGGFALISIGVYEAFQAPSNFNAATLTTTSGVLVSFIGGTFLVLYKSTMVQAKDYVAMLERINAVGMSVNILDTIDSNEATLRHTTATDIARQLLLMYTTDSSHSHGRTKRGRRRRAEA